MQTWEMISVEIVSRHSCFLQEGHGLRKVGGVDGNVLEVEHPLGAYKQLTK